MRRTARHPRLRDSLSSGFAAATARPVLLTLLWLWHLALAFALAIPFFRWLYDATAYRPAADAFAQRFSFGGLRELLQLDGAPILSLLQASVAGGVIVAVIVSPLLLATTLASLRDRGLGRRELGAVAASLYWPFLGAIVFGRGVALTAAGLTAAALRIALRSLSDSAWEPGFLLAAALEIGAAVLIGVLLLAAVDYGLVRLEAGASRGPFRAWLAGVRFAFTHPVLTLGIWGGAGAVFAAGAGMFIALRQLTSPAGTALPGAAAIAVSVILQQVFVFARTWLRVGLLGAEQHAFVRGGAPVIGTREDAGSGGALQGVVAPEAVTRQAVDDETQSAEDVERQHDASEDHQHRQESDKPGLQQFPVDRR